MPARDAGIPPCLCSASDIPAPGAEAPSQRGESPADVSVPGKWRCLQPRHWEVFRGSAEMLRDTEQSQELLQDPGRLVVGATVGTGSLELQPVLTGFA